MERDQKVGISWKNEEFDSAVTAQSSTVAPIDALHVAQYKLDEQQLLVQNAAILQTALDAIIIIDHQGKIIEFNPAAEKLFGYSRTEVLGQEMGELIVPPSLRGQHYQGLARYLATSESRILGKRVELAAMNADGTEFPVELAITRVPLDGPPVFIGYIRDISDRKRVAGEHAQLLAREQEARANELEAIFETITDGIFFHDNEGHQLRTNSAGREFIGLTTRPDYYSHSLDERAVEFVLYDQQGHPLPKEQWPVIRILQGEVLTGANTVDVIARVLDGRELEFSVSGAPVRNVEEQIVGGVSIIRDVTERRQLERRIQDFAREATARTGQLEATIEAMADGVFIYDGEARLIQANKTARELFALDVQPDYDTRPVRERVSQTLIRDEQGQLLPEEQWPMLRILKGEVLKGTNIMDVIIRALDGRNIRLSISGAPVRDSEERIIGGVLIVRDVTERRLLEHRTHDALNALLAIAEALVQIPGDPDETEHAEEQDADTLTAVSKVAQRLADLTCRVLGCQRVSISIAGRIKSPEGKKKRVISGKLAER